MRLPLTVPLPICNDFQFDLPDLGNQCPLTGQTGMVLRRREAAELARSYEIYSRMPLPKHLQSRYFKAQIIEYYNPGSGLRWYSPTLLGQSEFYEYLGTFPGYYSSETWDKKRTVEILKTLRPQSFVDLGCGDGLLLKLAAEGGLNGFGLDINQKAVAAGTDAGLRLYLDNGQSVPEPQPDVLVTLQTIEHVLDPVIWLRTRLERFRPRYVIVAVPCHDTMLGISSDPLVWPPHHATLWSGRALAVLAERLKHKILKVEYEPNTWGRFNSVLEREPDRRKLDRLPSFPSGRIGHTLFRALKKLKIEWTEHAHSALALMERI